MRAPALAAIGIAAYALFLVATLPASVAPQSMRPANPGKLAIVVMAEAHTPYVAPLLRDEYAGYRELARMRKKRGG